MRLGLLYPISPNFDPAKNLFDRELVEGLRELGYTPGRDVVFEFRSGAGGAPFSQLASAAGGMTTYTRSQAIAGRCSATIR